MTDHTEELAFLAAIRDAPDDDTPRLMLADFLENDADPPQRERAEFIRVQCELAGVSPQHEHILTPRDNGSRGREWDCDCRVCQLRRREEELDSIVYANDIALPLSVEYRRGFISKISLDWENCSAHLDTILSDPWVPGLDEVELTTWPETSVSSGAARHSIRSLTLDILGERWPEVRLWKIPPEPRFA